MTTARQRNWAEALPRPVALVLSGGASLGAIQVGMVKALAQVGLEPDLVVGTSVGSLNGAVVAEHPTMAGAATALEQVWRSLRRQDVFPGGPAAQVLSALRNGHLHPPSGLQRIMLRALRSRSFEQLERPLTVVASEVLTSHVRWFTDGPLLPRLQAATAIPGVFPPVELDGLPYWDAGSVANVPLRAAVEQGAASLVVLDTGDICHRETVPRALPEALLSASMTAMRQRVLLEAPATAERMPVLYLPRPCPVGRSLLDLDGSAELIEPTRTLVAEFLRDAPTPYAGRMVGAPHHHPLRDHDPSARGVGPRNVEDRP